MTQRTARLIAAVKDAMAAKGIKQNQVAAAGGMTASHLCSVLAGRDNMREERWKMICEYLGIDYEQITEDLQEADKQADSLKAPEAEPAEAGDGGKLEGFEPIQVKHVRKRKEPAEAVREGMDDRDMDLLILASYARRHIEADILDGMEMSPESLYLLLGAIRRHSK